MSMSMMDQMKAIWAALDDLHESNPETYQSFVKEQLETGSAFAEKAIAKASAETPNPGNAKEFEGCLESLVNMKIGPAAALRLSKEFESSKASKGTGQAAVDSPVATTSGKRKDATLPKNPQKDQREPKRACDGSAVEFAKGLATKLFDGKSGAEGKPNGSKVTGEGDGPTEFELKLPVHIGPTKVKGGGVDKKLLISEIKN